MKKKVLLVVDMQNDFITGPLGTSEAQAILPAVQAKITRYIADGYVVIFTRDTHKDDYLDTPEGKKLPVPHCIEGTQGWEIADGLYHTGCFVFGKPSFGIPNLAHEIEKCLSGADIETIEVIGLCTDICVVSNALILKAAVPDIPIIVDAACCAGVTPESHKAALLTMKMCQLDIINEKA